MALQLQAAKLFKVDIPNAVNKPGYQGVELTIARGAAGDVALDLYNLSGTFWADAVADATYGSYAAKAKAAFGGIVLNIVGLVSLEILANTGPLYRENGAPSAATAYRIQNGSTFPVFGPSITLRSDAAPATIRVVAIFDLGSSNTTAEFQ